MTSPLQKPQQQPPVENEIAAEGDGNRGNSAVEGSAKANGRNEEVNPPPSTSGNEAATNLAGLHDEERTTSNDAALAANNAPDHSSSDQPGKQPPRLGGLNQIE